MKESDESGGRRFQPADGGFAAGGGQRGHPGHPSLVQHHHDHGGVKPMSVIDEVRHERGDLARAPKKHTGIRRIVEDFLPHTHISSTSCCIMWKTRARHPADFSLDRAGLVFEHDGRPFEARGHLCHHGHRRGDEGQRRRQDRSLRRGVQSGIRLLRNAPHLVAVALVQDHRPRPTRARLSAPDLGGGTGSSSRLTTRRSGPHRVHRGGERVERATRDNAPLPLSPEVGDLAGGWEAGGESAPRP